MTKKSSTDAILLPIAVIVMVLSVFTLQTMKISLNGRVCNHSSVQVWLTVTELGQQKALVLVPGQCTDTATQDAEAIWGKDCRAEPCQYRAWKVGAGHFTLVKSEMSDSILQIQGWGVGSRWHITWEWPKPELSSIQYSLVK